MNRYVARAASAAALFVLAGCDKSDGSAQAGTTKEMPMMGGPQVSIALISNYAYMGQMASKGDGRSFSLFYADTATLAREGMPPLRGLEAISDLIRSGDEW